MHTESEIRTRYLDVRVEEQCARLAPQSHIDQYQFPRVTERYLYDHVGNQTVELLGGAALRVIMECI